MSTVDADVGKNLLEVAHENEVDLEGGVTAFPPCLSQPLMGPVYVLLAGRSWAMGMRTPQQVGHCPIFCLPDSHELQHGGRSFVNGVGGK